MQIASFPQVAVIIHPQWSRVSLRCHDSFSLFCDKAALSPDLLDYLRAYAKKRPISSYFLPSFQGSDYALQVYDILQKIPFGKSISYKELAILSGKPNGARGIGKVCHHNPFPLFIPCHRVIAHNGNTCGFAFGSEIKQRLLKFESNSF